jgi:hypothetical protein
MLKKYEKNKWCSIAISFKKRKPKKKEKKKAPTEFT